MPIFVMMKPLYGAIKMENFMDLHDMNCQYKTSLEEGLAKSYQWFCENFDSLRVN